MAKTKSKAQRKVRLARSGGSAIPFENNQGARLLIPETLTLKDLAKMGVSQIRLMPEGSPLPNGWWRSCDSPNPYVRCQVWRASVVGGFVRS